MCDLRATTVANNCGSNIYSSEATNWQRKRNGGGVCASCALKRYMQWHIHVSHKLQFSCLRPPVSGAVSENGRPLCTFHVEEDLFHCLRNVDVYINTISTTS